MASTTPNPQWFGTSARRMALVASAPRTIV
jgi:hypothetical protein